MVKTNFFNFLGRTVNTIRPLPFSKIFSYDGSDGILAFHYNDEPERGYEYFLIDKTSRLPHINSGFAYTV